MSNTATQTNQAPAQPRLGPTVRHILPAYARPMKRRSTAPLSGSNPLALCAALAVLAGACVAPPLLRGQAAATNPPAPPAAYSAEKEAAAEAARAAYNADALTNHIRLEKPLYTNAPYSEFRLRAAALAGDGYAASLCSGTNETERAFWQRLAATNGWVPAQIRLAKEYETCPVVTLLFRATNGGRIEVSVFSNESVDVAMKAIATNSPGAELIETVRRPAAEVARDAALAKHWRAKAQAALPRLQADTGRTNPHALLALAFLHADGDLVQSNRARANELMRQSAELGLALAQECVAIDYKSPAVDNVQAARWFFLAATQGLASAQRSLAELHRPPWPWSFDPKFQPRAAEAARWNFEVAHQTPGWRAYWACYELGDSYQSGSGVDSNRGEAVRWFRRAADMGGDESGGSAEYGLARCYHNGDGVAQDAAEAVKWYRKAAEQNHAAAQFKLGVCCLTGDGVAQDAAEAMKWFRKAAEQNYTEAQFCLGLCYAEGRGMAQDAAEAMKWLRRAAEQNHAEAQYNLGYRYSVGEGVAQNAAEAMKWFRKAAEQNHAASQYSLGVCYTEGDGVAKDAAEAVKWYRKAAEQNYAKAQYNLRVCYYKGDGVAQDTAEAMKWLRKAAEQNYAEAQFHLGCCYVRGDGVAQDAAEAMKWFRKAAEQGDPRCQAALGGMHFHGEGVPRDYGMAAKWLRRAAEQGSDFAQSLLGYAYTYGKGVPRDYVEAYKWYNLAAASSDSTTAGRARQSLDDASRDMTPSQIAEAQRLSREFVARKEQSGTNSVNELGSKPVPKATGTAFFITDAGQQRRLAICPGDEFPQRQTGN